MKTIAVLGLLALITTSAQALEPFRGYDSFGSAPLDPARWTDPERVRSIRGGTLNLMQRQGGSTGADSGASFSGFNENLANPAAVTALKAKIAVTSLEVGACTANTAVGQSRARIIGSFFNAGTPTPGSQLGDVLAQVRLTRFSNSADPVGTLRVQGLVLQCTTADCNGTSIIGNIVDLGTVTLGTAITVQLQWDQGGKSFLFGRDGAAFSGAVGYTESDSAAPGLPFKQLSTRLDLPSCQSAPRVVGSVEATFDNIAVNKSAAP